MVLLLRYYTTWGFVNISFPLRNQKLVGHETSHKLAASVYLLDMAIKQSRAVAADSYCDMTETVTLTLCVPRMPFFLSRTGVL